MKPVHVCLWGTFLGASPILYKTIKAILLSYLRNRSVDEFPFSAFVEDVERGKIEEVVMKADVFEVFMKASERISTVIQDKLSRIPSYRTRLVPLIDGKDLLALLHRQKVKYGARNPHWAGHAFNAVLAALPFVYLALIWKMLKQAHNPSDSVGKDTIGGEGIPQVTFDEVAGVDHAKAELAEIVDFMRNGSKYTALGARLPKGVLLSGPSGTGKTLLARAVACEAKVPFIACSASDFVEMLVGRGAARVRDLFQRGFASSPCIIFIDELDALAKKRGGLNSNDEREQTLNQLLTEMDGFGTSDAEIVVIAATNRPEVLDDALTRPGRFDRHVHVGLPDQCGRESILKVHLQNVRVGESIIIEELSAKTEGCSGADLANIVNDGALLAVRNGHNNVCMSHLIEAIERNIKSRSYYKSSISSFPDLFEIANR